MPRSAAARRRPRRLAPSASRARHDLEFDAPVERIDHAVDRAQGSGTGAERADTRQHDAIDRLLNLQFASDPFDMHQRGKTQICVWQNDDLSVVMTGDMSAREMLKVANLTYSDLNF